MDYKKLKLKVGIEIHQQLNTKKLFCNCPSTMRDDDPHFKIKRKMHASSGEAGAIDIAAKAEMEKKLTYEYEGYYDTTCAVELDDEPPHNMDSEALDIVLTFCKMSEAKVVDRIEVMRKIIANGSVTSGFQRTSLIGTDGVIKTKSGNVKVNTVLLEEDACKDISKGGGLVTYRLDRQGIPLIEIATDCTIDSPKMAQDVAKQIGMMLRSTGRVKRGLGTIRQDLNISINDGNRIEIKGAQDLKNIPNIIDEEIKRQIALNEIKDELKNIELIDYDAIEFIKSEIVDISEIFSDCDSKVIRGALDKGGVVHAVKLPGFKGFIGREIQANRRLGSELSDYAKTAAGVGGIFHIDELPKYGIEDHHVREIKEELNCSEVDAFILCADKKSKVNAALFAAYNRAKMAVEVGVISEVRNVIKEISSAYMRPIPGAARMYPETDVESVIPDMNMIEVPELIDAKIKRYEGLGLSDDLARDIAKDYANAVFEKLLDIKLKPSSIAEKFVSIPKELRRKEKIEFEWSEDIANFLFGLWADNKIDQTSIMSIIIDANKFHEVSLAGVEKISAKYLLLSEDEAVAKINELIDKELAADESANRGKLMGKLMGALKGKVDPKLVNQELSKRF